MGYAVGYKPVQAVLKKKSFNDGTLHAVEGGFSF